jgi:hypothetical protein
MNSEYVQVQHRYFRRPEGGICEEIWSEGRLIASHPLWDWHCGMPWVEYDLTSYNPSVALVRQGPCSLAIYEGKVRHDRKKRT